MSRQPPPPPPPGPPGQPGPSGPPGPPGPPPGGSTIALVLQGNVMTSNMITPTVRFNGWPVRAEYGENAIPVPPGPLRIEVHAQWLRQYGQAQLDVDVPPNTTVPVYYAAPLHQFARGNIGHQKQKRPGVVAFAVFLLVILAIVAAFVVLPLL